MESSVEEVKKKIDIIDFIGSYVQLKKTGRNFKATCPFHNEKTASFVVSPERQIWHCFGTCGDGGDVIKFLMKWEGISFFEALKELAEKYGIKLKTTNFEDKEWQRKQKLLQINSFAAEYFEYLLHKTDFGEKAKKYLEDRKISTQVIKKFQIGYAPSSWDSLLRFLTKKKYLSQDIFDAGLVVRGNRGSFYDRFRGRIIFPIKDIRGNIVGFSGRLLDSAEKEAKYINTPETIIYHKRETLYGINLAKDAMKKEGNVLLVEGEFDVISPYQYGIENVVAIKGSAVTKEQLILLKRYVQKVTLALDMDTAGEEAIKRGIEESENLDLDVNVIHFENGKDPDEAVRTNPAAFKKILEKPIPIYDFIIELAQKKYPNKDAFSKKKIGDEVVPFLIRIINPIVHSYYIKKLANILDVSDESVMELIRKEKNKKQTRQIFNTKKKTFSIHERSDVLQKYLVSLIFQNDNPYDLSEKIFLHLKVEDFTIPSLQKLCALFNDFKKNNPQGYDLDLFVKAVPSELKSVFDEVYLLSSGELGFEGEKIDKLIFEVKRYSLKKKITELLNLSNTDSQDKEKELLLLTEALKEVEKKLASM